MLTLKCKWCGGETFKTTIDMCDKCWFLYYNVRNNPDIAKRMLAEIAVLSTGVADGSITGDEETCNNGIGW